jgi:hypothetical protein
MDEARRWAEEQWSECCLGDQRRTRRAVEVGARMAASSDQSLPKQMAGMADLKAAYRLLDCEDVTLEALTEPHRRHVYRAAAYRRAPVLFVQDQTFLDFSRHPAVEGIGVIGSPYPDGPMNRGLVAQTCLAVAPGPVGRTILGLAALTVTTREQVRKRAETKTQRQARRTESELWFETLQAIGKPPEGALWISVGDRGSDIFSYFRQAADAGWHVLSRLCQDRLVEEIDAPGTPCSLLFVLRNRAPMANQTVEHPATGG